MTPDTADVSRDVLALVRASMERDIETIVFLIQDLNLEETRRRLVSAAALAAQAIKTGSGGDTDLAIEHMAKFARENLI